MTQALYDFPSYSPSFGLSNGHVQSILPTLLRQVTVPFERSRLELADGDFLLLDMLRQPASSAPWVILSHGLEGSSRRPYMQGMARAFHAAGWQVLAWNFRGCGGEPNRLPRFYHSGAIDDLKAVMMELLNHQQAEKIFLTGFSMGGNQTVLALAEPDLPDEVIGGVGFSVPLDLASCAGRLAQPAQRLYMQRFLRDLKVKISAKAERFPEQISSSNFADIKNFRDFDDRYTGPLHGFTGAQDYWAQCSSRNALPDLRRPTLIINAADDPFLGRNCFDCHLGVRSSQLFMEIPTSGGHVGFVRWKLNSELWSEKRALVFANYLLERT
ncbi:alpha/beta fold hydrolase [Reinekea sp.]|uniref:YheT family hydrolase n=1 Tax=Reinekea sp. TaxID=1970455 RepID=UPI00257F6F0C|nr:alpha/beta fold hydrolase [Reinekea sp.]